MLDTRTVHWILLGVIAGSAAAYVYANYRTHGARLAEVREIQSAAAPESADAHADVTEQEMLELFARALAVSPGDPELLSRYATYLFEIARYAESAEWFARLMEITPDDATMRTAYATALYGSGRVGDAIEEYQRALETDPSQTLALQNLVLAYLERPPNIAAATDALERLETIDPSYEALPTLRSRLDRARDGG